MKKNQYLMLGGQPGWHFDQLARAASKRGANLELATYESLSCQIESSTDMLITCSAGPVLDFDAVLTRTMPSGSLEQITFRLAALHRLVDRMRVINTPASLELAIDKYATLSIVNSLGYPVPETFVTQDRHSALEAFDRFDGDCIVKPLFGGEGLGVMRVQHRELARSTFATLMNLNAVIYLQRFVAPGGVDTRLLRLGGREIDAPGRVVAIRRTNSNDFRTNTTCGGKSEQIKTESWHIELADRICEKLGLTIASVDLIDDHQGNWRVIEVNGIPGWKGAQGVCNTNLADRVIESLVV